MQRISNVKLYGATDFKYSYLYEQYPGEIDFDFDLLNIISIDIETDSSGGFGSIDKADKEITAITICKRADRKTVTFGYIDYTKGDNDHVYIKCDNEKELLSRFLLCWNSREWRPDIVTGWNVCAFDIPIIVRRMQQILPEDEWLKLSPFKIIRDRTFRTKRNNTEVHTYDITGIAILDYMEAYIKYAKGQRESYSLSFITQYELEETKLDYSEYGSLNGLYQKNPELFMDYNIKDSTLILKMEDKLHYIEQIVTIAYIIKCNYENIMFTVKPWDVLVINYLMDRKTVVPFFEESEDHTTIIGGFVKEPKSGYYEDVVTLDYTSLYPSVAMSFNISPDTLTGQLKGSIDIHQIIFDDISNFTNELKLKNLSMTANGCLFKRDKRGFIPAIMKHFFDERIKARALEREAKKTYEADKTNLQNKSIYLKYFNLQTAYKLLNNSGYGAIANRYCRWFNNQLGEAITASGQMASKNVAVGINKYMNYVMGTGAIDYIIYQDTDSAYVNLRPLIDLMKITDREKAIKISLKFTKEKLQPEVSRICEELCGKLNAFEPVISMKLEKICSQAFFGMKKRYALNVDWDEGIWYKEPKLKVTGFEPVRSPIPKVCREAMLVIYKMIFKHDQQGIYDYIDEFKKKFYKMSFDQIGTATSCNGITKWSHPITLYKLHAPIHVKGAIFYNNILKKKGLDNQYEMIYDGDKVKYCYLIKDNPTRQEILSVKGDTPKEFELEQYIDYNHMWDKNFMKPMQTVLDIVGMQSKEIGDIYSIFS